MKKNIYILLIISIVVLFKYHNIFFSKDIAMTKYKLNTEVIDDNYSKFKINTDNISDIWGIKKSEVKKQEIKTTMDNNTEYYMEKDENKYKLINSNNNNDYWLFTGTYNNNGDRKALFYNPSLPAGKNIARIGENEIFLKTYKIQKINDNLITLKNISNAKVYELKVFFYERKKNENK